jgi:hypothetical protein
VVASSADVRAVRPLCDPLLEVGEAIVGLVLGEPAVDRRRATHL